MIHKYFLPREYSVILPGVAALILVLCVGKLAIHMRKKGYWLIVCFIEVPTTFGLGFGGGVSA